MGWLLREPPEPEEDDSNAEVVHGEHVDGKQRPQPPIDTRPRDWSGAIIGSEKYDPNNSFSEYYAD